MRPTSNFGFLSDHDPKLVQLGAFAERYLAPTTRSKPLAEVNSGLAPTKSPPKRSASAMLVKRSSALFRLGAAARLVPAATDPLAKPQNFSFVDLRKWTGWRCIGKS